LNWWLLFLLLLALFYALAYLVLGLLSHNRGVPWWAVGFFLLSCSRFEWASFDGAFPSTASRDKEGFLNDLVKYSKCLKRSGNQAVNPNTAQVT
jgi:hypothetical protein